MAFNPVNLPTFDVDGLPYDATYLIHRGLSFPVAFGDTIQVSNASSRLVEFTSAKGVRSITDRGRAPRNWRVSMEMPFKYVRTAYNISLLQQEAFYLITPQARRNNFLAPWSTGASDVFAGWDVYTRKALDRTNQELKDEGWRLNGNYARVFSYSGTDELMGVPSGVIPGMQVRFRAFIEKRDDVQEASAQLVGMGVGENVVWRSPKVTTNRTWFNQEISELFTIPVNQGITHVRELYSGVKRFSPMQAWVGDDIPGQIDRLGAWVWMDDFSFSSQPKAKSQLHSISFNLKEAL